MSSNAQEPRRWARGGHVSAEENRAAELFAAARELPPIPPADLSRIEVGISHKLAHLGAARWVKVLVGSVAIAGGTLVYVSRSPSPTPSAIVREPSPSPSPTPPTPPPPTDASPAAGSAPAAAEPIAAPVRAPKRRPPDAPRSAGGLAREASLLEEALRALRAGDASAALNALDLRDREFPLGQLAAEAQVARIDALMAAARPGEALSRLEQWGDLQGLPRATELELLRAELRADAGRCRAALETFEALDGERALRGRAVCRRALGDQLGAQRMAAEYLDRFPRGRWAVEMRSLAGR